MKTDILDPVLEKQEKMEVWKRVLEKQLLRHHHQIKIQKISHTVLNKEKKVRNCIIYFPRECVRPILLKINSLLPSSPLRLFMDRLKKSAEPQSGSRWRGSRGKTKRKKKFLSPPADQFRWYRDPNASIQLTLSRGNGKPPILKVSSNCPWDRESKKHVAEIYVTPQKTYDITNCKPPTWLAQNRPCL